MGTNPHVYYKNLYRFTKAFIAGQVVEKIFDDCAEGISVTLKGDGICENTVTDYFGEFKFDGLCPGTYTLEIDGKESKESGIAGFPERRRNFYLILSENSADTFYIMACSRADVPPGCRLFSHPGGKITLPILGRIVYNTSSDSFPIVFLYVDSDEVPWDIYD